MGMRNRVARSLAKFRVALHYLPLSGIQGTILEQHIGRDTYLAEVMELCRNRQETSLMTAQIAERP